jgi:flagellar biosynthesis protein FliR
MDGLSTLASSIGASGTPATLVAAGLLARVFVAVETAAHGLLPTVEFKARLSLSLIVALAALPAAIVVSPLTRSAPTLTVALTAVAGEALCGLCLGLTVAAAVGAVGWAGDALGGIAGLAWEDGEEAEAGSPAGTARLARWLAFGGFLAAGGLEVVFTSLIDGVRSMPVGFLGFNLPVRDSIESWAVGMPSMAIGLAVSLVVPVLAAVLVFQLVAALTLRVASCEPGPGLLHAATALVVLAMLSCNAPAWSRAAGTRLLPSLTSSMVSPVSVASPAPGNSPHAGSGGSR